MGRRVFENSDLKIKALSSGCCKERTSNSTLHWWQRLKMHFHSDMDLTRFESTPMRSSNQFRARPIAVSASDIFPFSPNRDDTSFRNTRTPRSPGEEFVNSLLNMSIGSNNPFQPDGTNENNHTSSELLSKSKSTSGFRKPVKLPDDYYGKTSLRDYLRHFNRCAVVNDWSPEESAVFL